MKKKSSRTEYREKRIELLADIIKISAKMLLAYKRDLETIKLPTLKKIKQDLENELTKIKRFSTK